MSSQSHERVERDRLVKKASERSFGLTISAFLLLWSILPLWKSSGPMHLSASAAALVLAAVALAKPGFLVPLNLVWAKLGWVLERTVTPVIIMVMFATVFFPFGMVLRAVGVLRMRASERPHRPSFWEERGQKTFRAEDFKRQF